VSEPLFEWRKAIMESDLLPSVRLVALVLSCHMDMDGGSCYPSLTTLMRETGLARSTVWEGTKKLEKVDLLDITPGGPGYSNRYQARFPMKVVRSSDQVVRSSDHPSSTGGPDSPVVGPELFSTSSSNSSKNTSSSAKRVSRESPDDFEARRQAALAYLKPLADEELRRKEEATREGAQ